MKCIYCGKEIANGNMCEECSNKRNNLGYTTVSNASENIQNISSTQRLHCKYCGTPLNDDGSCTSFICQKRREKEADKNTHFTMSVISAIFSSLYHAYLFFLLFVTYYIWMAESTQGSHGAGIIVAFLAVPLIYLFIPQIISYVISKKAIVAYRKYKDNTSISKMRKIFNYINVVNSFIFSIGLILLIAFIIIAINVNAIS